MSTETKVRIVVHDRTTRKQAVITVRDGIVRLTVLKQLSYAEIMADDVDLNAIIAAAEGALEDKKRVFQWAERKGSVLLESAE